VQKSRGGQVFYDLDYIIEISEHRLAEYTALYQKVLERLTNIILVYSALGIFLIPLIQHVLEADIKSSWFYLFFALFAGFLLLSLFYLIKLLLPAKITYLNPPKTYYNNFKTKLEDLHLGDQQTVDNSLKGSYILELQNSIDSNGEVLRRKNFFFYNALLFALLAVTPYIICIGFQLSKKEDAIQKVELVREKIVPLNTNK